MKIRKANANDAFGVAKVQVDSWGTTYKNIIPDKFLEQMTYEDREEKWENIISDQVVFVAEDINKEIIGFSTGGKSDKYPGYEGELYAIYILDEHRKKGIGIQLFKAVVEDLKQKGILTMIVLVLEDNKSRKFYEHVGAIKVDTVNIKIAGKRLKEIVYGWKDTTSIT